IARYGCRPPRLLGDPRFSSRVFIVSSAELSWCESELAPGQRRWSLVRKSRHDFGRTQWPVSRPPVGTGVGTRSGHDAHERVVPLASVRVATHQVPPVIWVLRWHVAIIGELVTGGLWLRRGILTLHARYLSLNPELAGLVVRPVIVVLDRLCVCSWVVVGRACGECSNRSSCGDEGNERATVHGTSFLRSDSSASVTKSSKSEASGSGSVVGGCGDRKSTRLNS